MSEDSKDYVLGCNIHSKRGRDNTWENTVYSQDLSLNLSKTEGIRNNTNQFKIAGKQLLTFLQYFKK